MARPQCSAVTTRLRRQRLRLLQPTWPAHRGGPRDPGRDHAPRALSPDAATRDVAADRGRSRQTVTPKPVSASDTSDPRSGDGTNTQARKTWGRFPNPLRPTLTRWSFPLRGLAKVAERN